MTAKKVLEEQILAYREGEGEYRFGGEKGGAELIWFPLALVIFTKDSILPAILTAGPFRLFSLYTY